MKKYLFVSAIAVIVLGSLSINLAAVEIEIIPYEEAPLLNGFKGGNEWYYPPDFVMGYAGATVWARQDSQFVYLCVEPKDTLHTGLDLYCDNLSGSIFMLHISAAHGMRYLKDSTWQETDWGPQELWTSNLVQQIYREGGKIEFIAPEVFEFQIDKKLLPGRYFKLMLHLKRPELWAPPEADTLSSGNWGESFELYRKGSNVPLPEKR